ncbi:MAG: SH3 domain-containing protein [Firmicutes bacterium]|nr:SH3 domain-containing protein [Bacillota bacterium]MCL5038238.1 SH3 domain-containing protein [Bacillota bacterium]
MGIPEEILGQIVEREQPLLELYRQLAESAQGEAHRKLTRELLEQRTFHWNTLGFLRSQLPREFLCLGTITDSQVNLRRSPKGSSELLSQLDRGTTVIIISYEGNWGQVQLLDGTTGYVFKAYLKCGRGG